MGICPICGIPDKVCMHSQVSGEGKKVKVHTEKRRYGKEVTVAEGVGGDKDYIDTVAKRLKEYCAAGGTVKGGKIEVQGSHLAKFKKVLKEEFGFTVE